MRLSHLSPKCKIGQSKIHGTGLFAVSDISKNEVVAIKGGHILSRSQWQNLETGLGSAEIQIAEDFYIAPISQEQREGSMLYTNHSCDPNIGIQGQIIFLAMRNILTGEELTHDWATTDDDDYSMKCNCGATQCRGTITGQDWKMEKLQHRYQGWFAWHLQCKIDAMHN